MKFTIICLFDFMLIYFALTNTAHAESVLLELLERSDVVVEVETTKVSMDSFARFGGDITVVYTTVQADPVQWFKGATNQDQDLIKFTMNRLLQTDFRQRRNDRSTDEKHFMGEPILAPIFPDIQEHKRYVVFLSKKTDGALHLSDNYCGIHDSTVYLREIITRLAEFIRTRSIGRRAIKSYDPNQYQENASIKASEAIAPQDRVQPQR